MSQLQFEEVALASGVDHHYLGVNEMGSGAVFFDADNDGDEDLWIAGGLNMDKFYTNDGKGNFQDLSLIAGLGITENIVTTGVISGDMDNDGFRDIILITHIGFTNILLKNNGDNTFTNVTSGSGIDDYKAYSLAATLADFNLDGLLDLYAAHYIEKNQLTYNETGDTVIGFEHICHQNKLYLNQGGFRFEEAGESYNALNKGCALAAACSDYDDDGDPDLLIANDFGAWITPNALLENQYPNPTFKDVSENSGMDIGIYGMGIAVGDYDQDQDLDYYITNLGRNALMQNQGNGVFLDKTEEAGVEDIFVADSSLTVGWGTAFMDFDNDSDLDLFVTNGYVPAAPFINNSRINPNRLFENNGDGTFRQLPLDSLIGSPLRGRGYACSDIDLDGDLDFLVANVNRQATSEAIQPIQLYRNITPSSYNWIQFKLEGVQSNRDGFGSKILLKTDDATFLHEYNGGFGTHASQHSSIVHFGLGDENSIKEVEVRWPSGEIDYFTNLEVNRHHTLIEGGTVSNKRHMDSEAIKVFPNPTSGRINIYFNSSHDKLKNLVILDPLGRIVFQKAYQSETNMSEFWDAPAPGLYQLQVRTALNRHSQKVIVLSE